MKDLLNRFTMTGCISECQINIFDTHINAKFVVNVANYSYTVFYFVSKKFNNDEYNKMQELSDTLLNKFVIVSGNISQLQTDGSIIFYASYIDKYKKHQEKIKIEIEGFLYNNYFINILNTPRGFKLNKQSVNQYRQSNIIYKAININQPTLMLNDNIIQDITDWDFSISKTKKQICAQDMESYISEWNIIKGYYG